MHYHRNLNGIQNTFFSTFFRCWLKTRMSHKVPKIKDFYKFARCSQQTLSAVALIRSAFDYVSVTVALSRSVFVFVFDSGTVALSRSVFVFDSTSLESLVWPSVTALPSLMLGTFHSFSNGLSSRLHPFIVRLRLRFMGIPCTECCKQLARAMHVRAEQHSRRGRFVGTYRKRVLF